MNEVIKQKWIRALSEFAEKPKYNRLLFPMKMAGCKGEMFSALGILCEIHSKETNTEWDIHVQVLEETEEAEPIKKKKAKKETEVKKPTRLPTITGYMGSKLIPPEAVLKWSGMTPQECSTISSITAADSFEGVIKHLKGIIEEKPENEDSR